MFNTVKPTNPSFKDGGFAEMRLNDMQMIAERAEVLLETSEDAVTYRITVRDLEVEWQIGVYESEHGRQQPLCIHLDLDIRPLDDWQADDYDAVPCYDQLSQSIRALAKEGHIQLVETLAHRIAGICLEDTRILRATVRVEKPQALPGTALVGVEITRRRN